MKVVVVVTTVTVSRVGQPYLRFAAFGPFGSWQAASEAAVRLCQKGVVAHPVKLEEPGVFLGS